MYSDQDGDEFLMGWSSQLALKTLEFNADLARNSPAQAVGDMWARRKRALQFLVSRSPDVTARVLLCPLFCEQTNPTLGAQLRAMSQHALNVDRAFWSSDMTRTPTEAPQEEVTFAATVMENVTANDGVLSVPDTSSPLSAQPSAGLLASNADAQRRATERAEFVRQVAALVQPRDLLPQAPPQQTAGHSATLSLRVKSSPPNMVEKALLMTEPRRTSFTNAWPSLATALRLGPAEEQLLCASCPPPLKARSLPELVQAELANTAQQTEGVLVPDEDNGVVIAEPEWAREERKRQEREMTQDLRDSPSAEEPPEPPTTAVHSHPDGTTAAATEPATHTLDQRHRPPPERTVVGEDEELVIVEGQFVVRKKAKPVRKKEEKPKPEVVKPALHDRKRPRDGDADTRDGPPNKQASPDSTADSGKSAASPVVQTPPVSHAELMRWLVEWDIPAALRDALHIGLEDGSIPPSQRHHVSLPLAATEQSAASDPDSEHNDAHPPRE